MPPIDHPLLPLLQIAVPLAIAELQSRGGPTDRDVAEARAFSSELGSRGDILLYGGRRGEAAALFARLARALAVGAFCPGGVSFVGARWEAEEDIR